MPICRNDPNKSYKGSEPCPKGLGYCPHIEKTGKKRIGKDGKLWTIKKINHGNKDWVKIRK